MATHSSASLREATSAQRDAAATRRKPQPQILDQQSDVINASLKRRARLIMTNGTIPRRTRSLIRYALEKNDPQLGQMVRRIWEGETIIDHVHLE